MNTRARISEHSVRESPKYDELKVLLEEKKMEVMTKIKITNSRNGPKRCMPRRERKLVLEQEVVLSFYCPIILLILVIIFMDLILQVDKLRKKLRHEENVHRALERAFTRPLGALPRLPSYLPSYTLELLAEVAVLEEEVVRLEEQVMNLRQGLYQEAIFVSSLNNNMDNGFELCSDRLLSLNTKNFDQLKAYSILDYSNESAISCSSPSIQRTLDGNLKVHSSSRLMNGNKLRKELSFSLGKDHIGKENQSNKNSNKIFEQTPANKASRSRMLDSQPGCQMSDKESSCPDVGANKLSEEILRCLLSIFTRISLPKNTVSTDSDMCPSVSGSCDTYKDAGSRDPYCVCTRFGRRDIGPYMNLLQVNSSSIDTSLISTFSFLNRRLKLLFRKLASVNISELAHQQKLAFWINIYNSCMMNAFLENGIPSTPEMVVFLMPKAKVNVSGHLFSAMTIEHFMLRMPYNMKHISPIGLKCGEVAKSSTFGLDWPEPLVTFALSCGSWSSPAVRIYTASQVEQQLEEAKRDYLQAAVGITKPNKFAIPKLLEWYLLDFAKDIESLMDWICLQLPSEIRKAAVECLETGRSCVIPQPIQVLPYEFRFRYLLEP